MRLDTRVMFFGAFFTVLFMGVSLVLVLQPQNTINVNASTPVTKTIITIKTGESYAVGKGFYLIYSGMHNTYGHSSAIFTVEHPAAYTYQIFANDANSSAWQVTFVVGDTTFKVLNNDPDSATLEILK